MKWRIFYEDGEFGSEDGSPADAPTHGVIAIVQKLDDEPRCQVIHTIDFYYWYRNMWWGGDVFGFLEAASKGASWVKQGRMVRTALFRAKLGQAADFAKEWDEIS